MASLGDDHEVDIGVGMGMLALESADNALHRSALCRRKSCGGKGAVELRGHA
jgi:hypothetical protein